MKIYGAGLDFNDGKFERASSLMEILGRWYLTSADVHVKVIPEIEGKFD